MLATAGDLPEGEGWSYEVKWDGMRILADIDGNGAYRLTSRNGHDLTDAFPELGGLAKLDRPALLDGEVVALDDEGKPSFERLSGRIGVRRRSAARQLAAAVPVTYLVFDLLALDGAEVIDRPLRERRSLLEQLELPADRVQVPAAFGQGSALLAATAEQGLEGVVAKRLDSPYRPGVRGRDWIKVSHRRVTDAVVVGWRADSSGAAVSLAVAATGPAGLEFRGTAGSGISEHRGRLLANRLGPLRAERPALDLGAARAALEREGFTWVVPQVVVEVRHLGEGERFRQPVVDRVRADLGAAVPAGPAGPAGADVPALAMIGGRSLRLTHLDKVLYPTTGTTKAEVIAYCIEVAPHLLELAQDRPVTRRRWPDGVGRPGFFEKNLPTWAPDWVRRVSLPTSKEPITFPLLGQDDLAALAWLAAHSALELHTPQWQVHDGAPMPPDRLVVDLDPGPGAGLQQCCEVAEVVRQELAADGLQAHPVLSGSKGLHLYAAIAPEHRRSADEVAEYVKTVAHRCAARLPGLVVVSMTRALRTGKVLVDWSQNRAAKTTLAPWSLRGTTGVPTVALPVTWGEVGGGDLAQVELGAALRRLRSGEVPLPW